MRTARIILKVLPWIVCAMLSIPPVAPAQDTVVTDEADRFKKEELAQMLAPIALYPDSLIAQVLMASTYPLEIVEAERWLRNNKDLKGEALDTALKEKSWDPSVKSLCHFPEVLVSMSEKLDQTRKLGDAFLEQEDDVMATIQELRRKAEDQGNLKSTAEQKVIVEREIIRIEPANPEVVYVPVYNPLYVYGPWWYPAYPPYYWYYPPGITISGGFIGFGPRIFLGFGLFSWVWFDWHVHRIHIDITKTNRFHRPHARRDFDQRQWRHDPQHRKGVAYRDRRTSERFGARPVRVSPATPGTRGFPGRIDQQPSRVTGERREGAGAPRVRPEQGGAVAPGVKPERQGTGTPGARPERERTYRSPGRDTPFRGSGEGSFERKAGERGGESRRSGEFKRPAGEIRPQGSEMRRQGGEIRPQGGETRRPSGNIRRPEGDSGRGGGGEDRGRDRGGSSGRGGGSRR